MTSTLRTLLDRVEKGEGRDLSLEGDLLRVLLGDDLRQWPKRYLGLGEAITSSIDAAMALVEKVLPDWGRLLYWNNCQGHTARLEDNANEYTGSTGAEFEARGATAPLALLAALLRAKIAQEERT